jgi:hypothetical protein
MHGFSAWHTTYIPFCFTMDLGTHMHTHTHTHTQTHSHTRAFTHTHTHTHNTLPTRTCTYTHSHRHTHAHIHTHTHTQVTVLFPCHPICCPLVAEQEPPKPCGPTQACKATWASHQVHRLKHFHAAHKGGQAMVACRLNPSPYLSASVRGGLKGRSEEEGKHQVLMLGAPSVPAKTWSWSRPYRQVRRSVVCVFCYVILVVRKYMLVCHLRCWYVSEAM